VYAHPAYDTYPVFCTGIDWLTCTNNYKGIGNPLERWAEGEITKRLASGGAAQPARRLGYEGQSVSGLFIGRNAQGACCQLSGPLCTPLTENAIRNSTGVSRIDVQVTIWTQGEDPHLARWTYQRMLEGCGGDRRRRGFGLILTEPKGETLTVNRRVSEQYGRLYDKAAEANLGSPRSVWRYEVELKGKRAQWLARELIAGGCNPPTLSSIVHAFYTRTGVQPAFAMQTPQDALEPYIAPRTSNVLDWYRSSVSKSIKRSVSQFGWGPTLEALDLQEFVREGHADGNART